MSSAGAQTPPPTTIPTFTIPEVPGFPDFTMPDFTVPPPTMPPPTITIPSPNVTIPADAEALIEDAVRTLEDFGEEFSGVVAEFRRLLDLF